MKDKKKKAKITAGIIIGLAALFVVVMLSFPSCTRAPATATPEVITIEGVPETPMPQGEIKVMSVNLAHGRKLARSQGLQSLETIHANLGEIAAVMVREQAHVVAVQEADTNSWWNKRFNHAAYVAEQAKFGYCVVGNHVAGWGLNYGTGLISRLPLKEQVAHTFHREKLYFSKGFTVATVPISPTQDVDVVAVHFDFASHKARVSEAEEMAEALRPRMEKRPLIVVGDFNSQWIKEKSPVRDFAESLGLTTWEPDSKTIITFPDFESRLDYILVSKELEFVDHLVLGDMVSDHRIVVATIRLKKKAVE